MSNDDYVTLFALGVATVLLLWPRSSRVEVTAAPPGCRFCGDAVTVSSRSACLECRVREKHHRQLLATQTRLEIRLLEKQLEQADTNQEQGNA